MENGKKPVAGEVRVTGIYSSPVAIDNLPIQKIEMTVDPETEHAVDFVMTSTNNLMNDDYNLFVKWCSERFGQSQREKSESLGPNNLTVMTSYWTVADTQIMVRTDQYLTKGLYRWHTKLYFSKIRRPKLTASDPSSKSIELTPGARYKAPHGSVHVTPEAVPQQMPTAARSGQALTSARKPVTSPKTSEEIRYQPPPYIWESATGIVSVMNDITEVPEECRAKFELNR